MIETEMITEVAEAVQSVGMSDVTIILSNTVLYGLLIAGSLFLVGLTIKGLVKIFNRA